MSTLKEYLKGIADAIRNKKGITGPINAQNFASEIDGIEVGGDTSMEDGFVSGEVSGDYSNDRVTKVGNYAFYQCSNLTAVNIPKATSIGINAFESCTSLTSLNIPNVTSIGNFAFSSCLKLTSVSLPKATNIGGSAFADCSSLTDVSLPLATSIGSYAFSSCLKLTSVSLPKATNIDSGAFNNCPNLTSISLPNVTSIGNNAFDYCSKLTSVKIPNATSIGRWTFGRCYSLTKVVITQTTKVCTLENDSVFNSCDHFWGTKDSTYNPTGAKDGYIYVPNTLVLRYKQDKNWKTYASQIKPLSDLYIWEAASESFSASMNVGFNINGELYFGTSNKPCTNIDLGPEAKNISFSSDTPSAFPAELLEYSYNSTTGILTINRVYYKYPTTTFITINYDKRKLDI